MTCEYCQSLNGKDDHRCGRCGRRLNMGSAPAPHGARENVGVTLRTSGANALAAAPVTTPRVMTTNAGPARRAKEISLDSANILDALPKARLTGIQPSLFGTELQPKIIPFESLPKTVAQGEVRTQSPVPDQTVAVRPSPRSNPRKSRATDESQAKLDFLQPAKGVSKTLKTSAEAVIYCDAVAAGPKHRSAAAALDAAVILAGFGMILGIFQFVARPVGLDSNALLMLAGMMLLTAMFYGLLFTIAGTLTPGLRWTELRLINFDGFPPDGRSRALRLLGCWIGILSGGLGLAWALLDEEGLTWHDHMSKTFPTLRESSSIVVRHGKR